MIQSGSFELNPTGPPPKWGPLNHGVASCRGQARCTCGPSRETCRRPLLAESWAGTPGSRGQFFVRVDQIVAVSDDLQQPFADLSFREEHDRQSLRAVEIVEDAA